MSDKLSRLLEQVTEWKPPKNDDPDQKIIDALDHALKATTPTHAGTPWDTLEEDKPISPKFKISEGE